MKKIYMIFCLQILCACCFAQQESSFVYDGHGRRDPFVPLVGKQQFPDSGETVIMGIEDVSFQGVALDRTGNNTVIINGEILKKGDKLGALVVKSIDDKGVFVTIQGKEYRLDLYEYDEI